MRCAIYCKQCRMRHSAFSFFFALTLIIWHCHLSTPMTLALNFQGQICNSLILGREGSLDMERKRRISTIHGAVIKWKHFPRYWPFVGGIHQSPGNFPYKGQGRGTLMFSLICTWTNGWVNRRRSNKTSKLRLTGLCEGNPPVTGGFPS